MSLRKKLAVTVLAVLMIIAFMPAMAVESFAGEENLAKQISDAKDGATIELNGDATLDSSGHEKLLNKNLTIDLNGHTLTINNGTGMEIAEKKTVTFTNGTIEANAYDPGYAVLKPTANATVTINNVKFNTTGVALFPYREAAAVNVTNSTIASKGYYAITTNASTKDGKYVTGSNFKINIANSKLSTSREEDHDNACVLVNVPCDLTITDSEFTGDRQGLVVRVGTATVKNSKIVTKGSYETNPRTSGNWGSGDEVAEAAIVVGNYQNGAATSYKADAALELTDSAVISENEHIAAIYADSNDTYKSSINVSGSETVVNGNVSTGQHDAATAEAKTSKVVINGGTYDTDVSAFVSAGTVRATVKDSKDNTTYAVGQQTIKKAAEDSSNTVTITNGSIDLTGVNANIKNDESNTNGTVTVDGTKVEAGHSVQANASETIAKLKSQIAALEAQIQSAANTGNTASSKITRLENDLAKVQAELKEAQKQASEGKDMLTAPAQVQNLKAKAGKKRITLTWTAQTSNTTGYRVYRATKKNGKYTMVKVVKKAASAKWTNKGLKKGKRYFYKVRAYKSITNGTLVGGYSNIAKATVK